MREENFLTKDLSQTVSAIRLRRRIDNLNRLFRHALAKEVVLHTDLLNVAQSLNILGPADATKIVLVHRRRNIHLETHFSSHISNPDALARAYV